MSHCDVLCFVFSFRRRALFRLASEMLTHALLQVYGSEGKKNAANNKIGLGTRPVFHKVMKKGKSKWR